MSMVMFDVAVPRREIFLDLLDLWRMKVDRQFTLHVAAILAAKYLFKLTRFKNYFRVEQNGGRAER